MFNECKRTSKDEARKLINEYKEKRQSGKKEALRVHGEKELTEIKMVKAMLSRSITCIICADGGSDLNIHPPEKLSKLLEIQPEVNATAFDTPRKCGFAAKTDGDGK